MSRFYKFKLPQYSYSLPREFRSYLDSWSFWENACIRTENGALSTFLFFISLRKFWKILFTWNALHLTTISRPVLCALLARWDVWHCLFLQIYGPHFTEFTESICKTFHLILCGVCSCASRIFKETVLWRPKTKTVLNSSKTSSISVPRTYKFRFREL